MTDYTVQFHKDESVGRDKELVVGFSWTALFFGPIPFFFRGLHQLGIIWLVLALISGGLSNLYLVFYINKMTANTYLDQGYERVGNNWDKAEMYWSKLPMKAITNFVACIILVPIIIGFILGAISVIS